jgi:hypothetical protein
MRILGDLNNSDFADGYYEGVTDYSSLAVDVARIGSTPAILLIDDDVMVTTAVTVPTTLKLKWVNGAVLEADGGSLVFSGNPFVDGQERDQVGLFSQFSATNLDFTGAAPLDVSSEIVSLGQNSLTQRLYLLTNWFALAKVTFHCFPRPITDTDAAGRNVILNDYHSLCFKAGTFTSNYGGGGISGSAPFVLGSYARFYSEPGAFIQSSSVGSSPQIVATKNSCLSSVIEDCNFTEGGGQGDGVSTTATISPGSFNCHIRRCRFSTGIGVYHAGITSSGGVIPTYCTIDGNYCSDYMTQNLYLTGGYQCKIINNVMNFKDLKNGNAFCTFIDIEPNSNDDDITDLEIANNFLDFRGTGLSSGRATGTLTAGSNPADTDTIAVNGVTFTFVTGASTATNVNIKATKELTMAELAVVLNASVHASISVATYTVASAVLTVTYDTYGEVGNAFTLADSTGSKITRSAATLTGGTSQYAIGIYIQGINTPGAKRVQIHDNYLLSDDDARIQIGIYAIGVTDLEIFNNVTRGTGTVLAIGQCQSVKAYDNIELGSGSLYAVTAVAKGYFYNNLSNYSATVLTEGEGKHIASAVGTSVLTFLDTYQAGSVAYESYEGLTLTYNATDYPIVNVVTTANPNTITVTGTLPTLTTRIFAPGDITTGTDTINYVAHGFENGAAVRWDSTTGTPPAASSALHFQGLYIIRVDADNVKVATTLANALANSPIDITSQGTGSHQLTPQAVTKFSNNIYRENKFDTVNLEVTGTSIVTSDINDMEKRGTVTIDPASVGATTVATQTFTLTGAAVGDTLVLNPPAAGLTAGLLVLQSFVSTANTISIVFYNTTGAPIDEGSASWTYKLSR